MRKKCKNEEWAALAEDLKLLTEKGFPELQPEAREQLALSHYLGQIDSTQIAFSVKQRKPKSVDEAVSATLEMESYLHPRVDHVANIGVEKESTDEASFVAAVRTQQDTMMDMLRSIMQRLERLEAGEAGPIYLADDRKLPQNKKPPVSQTYGDYSSPYKRGDRRPGVIECRKCGEKGHYARGCAVRRPRPHAGKLTTLDAKRRACEGIPKEASDIYIVSVDPVPAYRITGQVNDSKAMFVLDTGAAVTLLQKSLWDQVNPDGTNPAPWTGQRLVGVDGTTLQVHGVATVQLFIAEETFATNVIVVEGLAVEAILGLDFLEIHKCIIDLEKELHFTNRGTSISLCTANTDHRTVDTIPIQVSLIERVHLPPYSEMETTALTSCTTTNGTWLVEDKTDKRSTVMVARAMVSPTGQSIPVRLFNPANTTIVIHAGTHIATMENVESPHNDVTVASVQPDISPFKQEMLEQMVRQSEEHLTDSQRKQLLQLLECYSDVFADCKDDFGRTNRIQHQIPTCETSPSNKTK